MAPDIVSIKSFLGISRQTCLLIDLIDIFYRTETHSVLLTEAMRFYVIYSMFVCKTGKVEMF